MGVFLGQSPIIIQWTWGVFPPKFAVWPHPPPPPPTPFLYNFGQRSTKKRCGICSTKLPINTLERHQCFSLFSCFQCFFDALVNFAQISYLFLEFTVLVWAGKYPPSIFWLVHLFAFILLAFLLQWKFRFSILNL